MAPATTYSTTPTLEVALSPIDATQHELEMAPEVAGGNTAVKVLTQDHLGEETRVTPSTTHHGPSPSVAVDEFAISTILARTTSRCFDRFPALSKILPEPRQEGTVESRRSESRAPGEVGPERQRPKSDRFNGGAALNDLAGAKMEAFSTSYSTPPVSPPPGPFPHSHAPQISLPTTSANTTPAVPDSLPDLPWPKPVVVGLMIVFSVLGFTFVALTCLVHFPLQRGYLYKVCIKLRIVPRVHEHDDYEDSDSESADQLASDNVAITSGTLYRLSPLPLDSPMPTTLLPSSPALHDSSFVACASNFIDPKQPFARRRRLPPSPLNLFPPRIHATSSSQRSASPNTPLDEESLTPRSAQPASVLDPLRNLPPMSAVLSGLGSPVGSETTAALLGGSEGLRRRKAARHGWGGGKSLVEKFEGVVDKVADGLVRYVKDGAGDEGLLLPVTAEETLEEVVDI